MAQSSKLVTPLPLLLHQEVDGCLNLTWIPPLAFSLLLVFVLRLAVATDVAGVQVLPQVKFGQPTRGFVGGAEADWQLPGFECPLHAGYRTGVVVAQSNRGVQRARIARASDQQLVNAAACECKSQVICYWLAANDGH